jgi:dihydroxyacetone kinase
MEPTAFTPSADPAKRALFERACRILIGEEAALNALDAKQGDGDTGSTLATAARTLQASLDQLPFADTAALFTAVGQQLSQSMGGSSGVLLAIFFSAAGDAARGGTDAVSALRAGLARIRAVGGAELGDRTMVDALSPALEMLGKSVDAAAIAARAGADATARMTRAKAGRAAYVSADLLNGVPDPGAEAVARLLSGLTD